MKVLILTSYKPGNIYKVNYLTDRKNVVAKVIENRADLPTREEKLERRMRMVNKYGYIKTINKLLFNKYSQYFLKQNFDKIVRDTLFPGNTTVEYTKDIPTEEVSDINQQKSIDFISKFEPDIIAVCGTSLLKSSVFNLSKEGTINIHSGITPEYRSNESVFWALYNQEPDKVGVTIHFIDAGIDTGGIIYQEAVGVSPEDNLATLYCKCQMTGIALMSKAIDDIENNTVKTLHKDKTNSRAYFSMDLGILQYFLFKIKFSMLKKRM